MDFADHILVATDFSEASEVAIDAAAVLAQQLGARITLFHVFDPDPLVPPGVIPDPELFREKIEKEMRGAVTERLEQIRNDKISGVQAVDIVVATDRSTANAITEHAEQLGADLIIVATHGRTGLAHLLIGSVAEKVVRHAHCPVLAVRPVASHD